MKYRIDFVTNSSSSGHLVLTMYFKNGQTISGEYDSPGDGWYMGDEQISKDIRTLKSPAALMRYLYNSFLSDLLPGGADYSSVPVRVMDAMNDYSDLASIEVHERIEYEDVSHYDAFYDVASGKSIPKSEMKNHRKRPPFEPYLGPEISVDGAKRPLSWIESMHHPSLDEKRKAEITADINGAKKLSDECALRVLKNYIPSLQRSVSEVVGDIVNPTMISFFLFTRVYSIVGETSRISYDLVSKSFPAPSFPGFERWASMMGDATDLTKTNYVDNLALSKLSGVPAKILYRCGIILASRMDSCGDAVHAVLNAYRDLF